MGRPPVLRKLCATPARRDNRVLLAVLALGAVSHGYNLFRYPLYLTDEGIYVQQAWSVLREWALSPYTYFYDHAPGGWLVLAAWVGILPGQFDAFGNAINTGRVLMVLVHLASVYFLFEIARRFSGGKTAPLVATTLFSLSPLAIFYQRQVLLDNLMVFWLLLSLFLLSKCDDRITTALAAGLAFGMAVITKENAIFFGPVLAFLLYRRIRDRLNRRFARGFFFFAAVTPVAFYFMYAILKQELLPTGLNFDLANPPADRVSLAFTVWWQLNRTQGTAISGDSIFWQMMRDFWLPKDLFLLAAGGIATVVLLVQGVRDRRRNEAQLVAALLVVSYAIYLARGSVLLEFYIVPLVPLLALNIGMVTGALLRPVPVVVRGAVLVAAAAALLSPSLLPIGGYLVVRGDEGQLQAHDMYRLRLTEMQEQQLAWVKANVPPTAKMIIDDDMWVSLRDAEPAYRFAHSHWKASADPEVRDELFGQDWREVDYIVMSNKMRIAMERNNGDGREDWIFDALDNHSEQVWQVERGDVALSVHRVGADVQPTQPDDLEGTGQ
jgi:4-amino-4-deoxy-L-arabinose transferase-like glycosyltransferase